MGTRCANHVTPLYPQKLALTSPTGGGRSVGMVRSRTEATEFSLVLILHLAHTVYFCVLFGSQNKQRLFPYTTVTIAQWDVHLKDVVTEMEG